MFELLWVFAGTQLLAVGTVTVMQIALPETEPRPDPGTMALGMVMVAVLTGTLAVLAAAAGVPKVPAMVGIPAALAVLVAAIRIPLVETAAARTQTALAGLVAAGVLVAMTIMAGAAL